jgi:hypothetical protein
MKRTLKFDAPGFIAPGLGGGPALITTHQAQLMEFLCGKGLKPGGADSKEFFHSSPSVLTI